MVRGRFGSPLGSQPVPADFTPLVDGRSFADGEGNTQVFRIEEGTIIRGDCPPLKPATNTSPYLNFELRLKFKVTRDDLNAGIQIPRKLVARSPEMVGYQADAGQHFCGSLYDERKSPSHTSST